MCAAPISADDAAWTAADAHWERLQVEAAEAFAAEDPVRAAARWAAALRIARAHFEADDPRLATSLANQACALRLRGEAIADRLFTEALQICNEAPAWLARQRFAPRSRSSLFHLRLEAKHRGAYDANLRRRAEALLHTARAGCVSLAAGAPARPPDTTTLQTFLSARPDAMRKVRAAAQLLAAPAADHAEARAAQEGSSSNAR